MLLSSCKNVSPLLCFFSNAVVSDIVLKLLKNESNEAKILRLTHSKTSILVFFRWPAHTLPLRGAIFGLVLLGRRQEQQPTIFTLLYRKSVSSVLAAQVLKRTTRKMSKCQFCPGFPAQNSRLTAETWKGSLHSSWENPKIGKRGGSSKEEASRYRIFVFAR